MESRGQKLPRPNDPRPAAKSTDVLPSETKSRAQRSENGERSNNTNEPLEAIRDRAQLIAERAYRLWENDGRPDGRDQEYWFRAEEELKRAPAR